MTTTNTIHAADLFCGAGGTSQGFLNACARLSATPHLVAINHWPRAIATHTLNHPHVTHVCDSLEKIDPLVTVPGGRLNLLCASPECTHHSRAAGGRPRNDQSRSTAWRVIDWANRLHVENILIENVPEFADWGPLRVDGKPNKRKRGQTFRAFVEALGNAGFQTIEHRLLTAADYGDPTTRERLFIIATRRNSIRWPDVTHLKQGGSHPRWRAAREIIDWDIKGKSIFRRKKPLCQNTLRRIAAGLRKFGGPNAEPFLVMLRGTSGTALDSTARSMESPVPTCMGSNHIALCEPFFIQTDQTGGGGISARPIDYPVYTIPTKSNMALVEPFIIQRDKSGCDGAYARSADDPCYTVLTKPHMGLVEPFITEFHGGPRGHDRNSQTSEPLPTQDTSNRFGFVQPMIIGQQSGAIARPVTDPVPTVATAGKIALVQPFVVKFYGAGEGVKDLTGPLDTVTTRDRFMLINPVTGREIAELDIFFRMLQPHELAAAQGFPRGYQFTGTREDQVKQIGNAVPVNLATALCEAVLR